MPNTPEKRKFTRVRARIVGDTRLWPHTPRGPDCRGFDRRRRGRRGRQPCWRPVGLGIPKEEAETYAEAVRRGDYLVIVNASDEDASKAADILNRHHPIDIHERAEHWRRSGWQGYQPEAGPHTGPYLREEKIPVVEEQLKFGKQGGERGGVRIRSYVTERPAEVDVALREEKVQVQRQPADGPQARLNLPRRARYRGHRLFVSPILYDWRALT